MAIYNLNRVELVKSSYDKTSFAVNEFLKSGLLKKAEINFSTKYRTRTKWVPH